VCTCETSSNLITICCKENLPLLPGKEEGKKKKRKKKKEKIVGIEISALETHYPDISGQEMAL